MHKSKLGIIKLRDGGKEEFLKLTSWFNENSNLLIQHMKMKGYYWDSLFIDKRDDGDYLIYVIKSPDWSKIATSDQYLPNEFSTIYLKFKNIYWETELKRLNDILQSDLNIES